MNPLDKNLIGTITLVVGVSTLLQVVLLKVMVDASRQLYGTLSDYF